MWFSGLSVHVAQWFFCPCSSVVFPSTWLSGPSVHVAQWSFCPRGLVVLLSTWLSGPSVHVAQWHSTWHQSYSCVNFKIFFLVLWKMLLGFCWGIALLKLQAPFDKMSISHYWFFQQVSISYIKGCVELCQTFSCFMKMILWFLSLTLFLCSIAFHNLCTY